MLSIDRCVRSDPSSCVCLASSFVCQSGCLFNSVKFANAHAHRTTSPYLFTEGAAHPRPDTHHAQKITNESPLTLSLTQTHVDSAAACRPAHSASLWRRDASPRIATTQCGGCGLASRPLSLSPMCASPGARALNTRSRSPRLARWCTYIDKKQGDDLDGASGGDRDVARGVEADVVLKVGHGGGAVAGRGEVLA